MAALPFFSMATTKVLEPTSMPAITMDDPPLKPNSAILDLSVPRPCTLAYRPCVCRLEEQCSRPQILFGMGEEGGGPIYVQALGLRLGRPPRTSHLDNLFISPFYPTSSSLAMNGRYKVGQSERSERAQQPHIRHRLENAGSAGQRVPLRRPRPASSPAPSRTAHPGTHRMPRPAPDA